MLYFVKLARASSSSGTPSGGRAALCLSSHDNAMRTTRSLFQSCIALLLSIASVAQAQHEAAAHEDEVVPPLVLPEVKALPAYSFRGPFPEGAKIGGFEVTGQAWVSFITELATCATLLTSSPLKLRRGYDSSTCLSGDFERRSTRLYALVWNKLNTLERACLLLQTFYDSHRQFRYRMVQSSPRTA